LSKPKIPTFSIITPTRNRDGRYENGYFDRCLRSIKNQRYPKDAFEHILIDDNQGDKISKVVGHVYNSEIYHTIVEHEFPTERYIAYNDGMKAVKNEWIVFLDDDDEYDPNYLDYVAEGINRNPKNKLFNYGGMVNNRKDNWQRPRGYVGFEQKKKAKVESGDIVNGQFCFHRDALKHKDVWMPDTNNIYVGADMANIPGYGSDKRVLGNPWGQDFYIFYKLTRHYISKPLDLYVFICYPRGTEKPERV